MSDPTMPLNGTAPFDGTMGAPPPFPGIPISERAAYLAKVHIGATSVLLALCILTFGTRIYQRIVPVWKIGLDDWFITAGFILTIACWAMLLPIMVPEPGFISLERGVNAGKNTWLAIPVWGLAMTCIKISIALTLLRIQGKERSWRIFLYTVMAIQTIYGIGNTIFDLAIACRPLSMAWDPLTPGGTCVSVEAMRAVSNLGSSINITTDVLLSLAPATFLRKLNRPLRERVFVCILMGMGLVASFSSIMKTIIVKDWGDPTRLDDFWAMGVSICTYTSLEQLLGVLAACVPAMKGIFQSCLGRMGVSLNDSRSRGARSGYYLKNRSATGAGGTNNGVLGSNSGNVSNNSHSHSRHLSGEGLPMGSLRYARGGGRDDKFTIDEDEEECLDMPEIHRNISTPKSAGSGASVGSRSMKNGVEIECKEQLPAHAI
ncbi:hypothetical protein B0H63DRAFT_183168 [Podospora didyma]|uniref:Rhodopsin domain-containing protein n=1 Tax=Podospora didyma TaxID=330526 RepID=A0AAE0NPT4_9PEZI|nr:hypothetical protein B0H63DRAFT_183168 [Podospora didyma]